MPVHIKNWKLALLALFGFCLFIYLGCWQLARAKHKEHLLQTFHERTAKSPLTWEAFTQLNKQNAAWQFYRITLQGNFDNAHTLLLDNKIYQGKVGYEIYTPFKVANTQTTLLVDRGFVFIGNNRSTLPMIKPVEGKVTITGLLNVLPHFPAYGNLHAEAVAWPLRIEYFDLPTINQLLQTSLASYVITLAPNDAAAYPLEWQIVTMGPERHRGYAVQWFALALTLLILFAALNRPAKVFQP